MTDSDLLILGGIAVLAWFLSQRTTTAAAANTSIAQASSAPSGTDCGGYGCGTGNGDKPPAQDPGLPPSASTCPAGTIFRNGICDNPALGSQVNDTTLQMINAQIDASNAAGTWDRSWQLAAQRDAWIKKLGY